jgi:hypothetical protein
MVHFHLFLSQALDDGGKWSASCPASFTTKGGGGDHYPFNGGKSSWAGLDLFGAPAGLAPQTIWPMSLF